MVDHIQYKKHLKGANYKIQPLALYNTVDSGFDVLIVLCV